MGPMVGAAEATEGALVGLDLIAEEVWSVPSPTHVVSNEVEARSVPPLVHGEASLLGTFSDSGSCSTGVPGLGEGSLAWGKKEEYFQVSLSEVDRGELARAGGSFTGRAASDRLWSLESVESELPSSPCMSYTGPNSAMQLVPRRIQEDPELEEVTPEVLAEGDTAELELQQERLALGRIKLFCTSILKKLAPPLLREVESSSRLRADAEPFTPRRMTRSAAVAVDARGKKAPKASVAETVLLKALGICPEELSVDEEHLASFNEIFDSPLGDRHVRVMASIFGKMVPQSFEQQEGCRVVVAAH